MSKNQQQAPQRPPFLQQLLTFAIIFLVIQYFIGQSKAPPDTRTVDQIVAALREDNKLIKDVSAAAHFRALEAKLKDEKLPADQKQRLELEGIVLTADTQLKAGILRNDLGRLNTAYTLLHENKTRLGTSPAWNQPVVVADERADSRLGWSGWTPDELFQRTVKILDEHNRHTLVWGFFPGYQMVDFLVHATGANPSFSYALAAMIVAIAVRALLFPISQKQMMHSRQMQQLQPLVKEVQEKYKGNATEIQTRTMELYKEYGLNPVAGCLPMLLQLPLIYLVYQCMIQYRFEFQKGTFLWISPAGHSALPNLIAPNLGEKDLILLTLYGISMIATSFLMPVADPSNARQQRIIGVSMSALFAVMMFFYPSLPSAFVLYWTATNILATIQSILIYRSPMQQLVKVNTKAGGVYPTDPRVSGNGNGKPKGPFGPTTISAGPPKIGTPAKHKPKKRK